MKSVCSIKTRSLTIWSAAGLRREDITLMRSCLLMNLSSTSIPSTHCLPLHHSVYIFSDSFINCPGTGSFEVPSSPVIKNSNLRVKLLENTHLNFVSSDYFPWYNSDRDFHTSSGRIMKLFHQFRFIHYGCVTFKFQSDRQNDSVISPETFFGGIKHYLANYKVTVKSL